MADKRFFQNKGPYTLKHLAEISDARIEGPDPELVISDVGALDSAGADMVSFFSNPKYLDAFKNSKASACVVPESAVKHAPEGMTLLVSKDSYKSFAKISGHFYPPEEGDGSIHSSAIIDETAILGKNLTIGAGAVVEAGAKIGDNTIIGPQCFVGKNVIIGEGCRLSVQVSVRYCHMGDNVTLYAGSRIGEDGFGFAPDPVKHVKIPQLGRVIIGSNVEIGANTCVDRGAGPDTIIGDNCWIDNLIQIGHNVKMGTGVIIAAQTGISGSSTVEDYVLLGGQVGVTGHLTIGSGAQVSAMSGVISDIPKGQVYAGFPARPIKEFFRSVATLRKLMKNRGSSK
ncbi:UDP-3-O-(3-hydroxymyristoyl)glucosamine N-acyltransferase [Sneathiella aquimaris]|uniref:UDP-3-O-(3-hydroxymyristoyl)glucosamine N-acyltransferase n=1 Tax=Sneathiella aquimaris TaxID=2599305 RepID=UPI00146CBB17|nr:UDP-3-O-(3-hydroxymyristoyl)glucosamine N-acyltransferase [Sneathiella aquimaris]